VKVYVAFNTLVKQMELERAVDFLFQLEQIGVDAVIVQDMGIARIVTAEFPRLRLHASTQMSIHNSAGVQTCARLGFRRVVLARELTLDEITGICALGGAEIEVFVHGALCYSLSGMCLASSFFGGSSGNRGRCTQVCRRSFDNITRQENTKPGYFFSPGDFSAIDSLPMLAQAGVRSLKIEGRMKGTHYLRTVVSAFRMALDNPENAAEAKRLLAGDMARRKTRLFLDGVVQEGIIDPAETPGTGETIGVVGQCVGRDLFVETRVSLRHGDLLRIQPLDGRQGVIAGIAGVTLDAATARITLDKELACGPGDTVFRVNGDNIGPAGEVKFNVKPARFLEHCPEARAFVRRNSPVAKGDPNRDRRLFIKVDSLDWLPLLTGPDIGGVICAFDEQDFAALSGDSEALGRLGRAGYVEPPSFIPQGDLDEWGRLVHRMCSNDSLGLVCRNLAHAAFARGIKRVRADYGLWCLNRVASASLATLGLRHFSYSLEDDSMNIRDCASNNGMAYLFTHVPLFTARIRPSVAAGERVADRLGRKAFCAEKYGLYHLVAEESVCLFNKREKLEEWGIRTFCIDLSFMKPDARVLSDLLAGYREQKRWEGSCMFNFKGGLK
jgi:putative protease